MKRNLITNLYKGYTKVAPEFTEHYENVFGFPCDLYFPMHAPAEGPMYQSVNLFEPHSLPEYPDKPDATDEYFYIPHLIKRESMNSVAEEFDNFELATRGKDRRPFIETTHKKELPIATKVVVKIDESKMFFFVDQKKVVTGAGGHMILRMFLSPLTLDTHERKA